MGQHMKVTYDTTTDTLSVILVTAYLTDQLKPGETLWPKK